MFDVFTNNYFTKYNSFFIDSCIGDMKKVCYDVRHFVIFFPAENMDSGYVNVVDANDKTKGVFNIKITDLIQSTQSGIVRVFYK